jgi:secretion/DNA translocation related TadE-like protein
LTRPSVAQRWVIGIRSAVGDDRGAGGIVAIATISLSLGLATTVVIAARSQQLQAQAEFAADQAALAGADTLNGRFTGFPCEVARKVAEENMAKLDECRIVGFEMFIRARVETLGMVHFASARAASPSTVISREQ